MTDSKIDYVLDEQVARAAFLFQSRRQQQYLGRSLPLTLLQWLMGGALGGLVLIAALAGHGALAASFGVLLLFYLSLLAYRHLMCVLLGRKLAAAAGSCSLSLSPEGLGSRSAIGEARYPWSQVREVSQQPGWLAICLGPQGLVLALPERALGDAGQRQALLDALAEGMALGRQQAVSAADHVEASGSRLEGSGSPPAAAPAEAAPQAEATAARSSLPGDLLQLGRILCLRAPRPGTLEPDPLRLLLPVLCFALLTLGLQVLSQGFQGELVGYDASLLLSPFAAVALVTALVLLVGGGRREGGRLGLALVLLMMLLPLAHVWNQELAMAVIEFLGLEGEEGPGMVLLILI
ncbi:MAG: YcxB family protein, partial [Azovibrio sp.]|nr:YcxB family protein [Azovibrio sp.]